jgi:hypothetical protein
VRFRWNRISKNSLRSEHPSIRPSDYSGCEKYKKSYLSPYSKEEVKSILDSVGIKYVTNQPKNQHLDPRGVAQHTTRYSTPLGSLDYHLTRAIMCDSDGIGLLSFLLTKRTLRYVLRTTQGAGNTKKYVFTYSKEEVKSILDSVGIKYVTNQPKNQHLDPRGVEQNTTTYSTPLGSLDYHNT